MFVNGISIVPTDTFGHDIMWFLQKYVRAIQVSMSLGML